MLSIRDLKASVGELNHRLYSLTLSLTKPDYRVEICTSVKPSIGDDSIATLYFFRYVRSTKRHPFRGDGYAYRVTRDGAMRLVSNNNDAVDPLLHGPPDRWEDTITSWFAETLHRLRAIQRAASIKEELAAAVWAPARVERLLEAGWDVIDAL